MCWRLDNAGCFRLDVEQLNHTLNTGKVHLQCSVDPTHPLCVNNEFARGDEHKRSESGGYMCIHGDECHNERSTSRHNTEPKRKPRLERPVEMIVLLEVVDDLNNTSLKSPLCTESSNGGKAFEERTKVTHEW